MSSDLKKQKQGFFYSFIRAVEVGGNKLPHPFFMFLSLGAIVLVISCIFGNMGMSVTYTTALDAGAAAKEVTVSVQNLLSSAYIKTTMANFVKIYVGFSPLGLVMLMMISIGYAQDTGLFDAAMRKSLLGAPTFIITFMLALVGVCGNVASNAGIVFAATMGAALFASLGRNPILGAVTGYAAGHGGFTANLIIAGTDVLLGGITESASLSMGIKSPTHPMINYFFMVVAAFVIAGITTFVTEKIMPNFIKIGGISDVKIDQTLTAEQHKGLKFAGIAILLFAAVLLLLTIPNGAFFRAADGSLLPKSPLIDSIVSILFLLFITVGTAYGVGAKTVTKQSDIPKLMAGGLKGSLSFLIVAVPASFFIQFFNDSKLATVLAVNGGNVLKSMNLNGIPLAIAFVLLTSFLNLFMTGGSEKWMVLAPVFVPMFAMMNFSPALTQLCFRIGDSVTNPIAPVNYFLPIIIAIMTQYKRPEDDEIGVGTLLSMTLPYSIAYAIGLIALLTIWMLLGLPLGPATPLYLV